jgi:hypothetical protein
MQANARERQFELSLARATTGLKTGFFSDLSRRDSDKRQKFSSDAIG